MSEGTPETTGATVAATKRRRRWHLIAGVPIGTVVGAGLGALEGARQAMFEAVSQGTGADAGVYLIVFGPIVAAILAGMGLAAGAFTGTVVGVGIGSLFDTLRRINEDEEGLLGHPLVHWLLHLGLWALLVFLCVHFVEPLEHLLHQLGIVAREAPH